MQEERNESINYSYNAFQSNEKVNSRAQNLSSSFLDPLHYHSLVFLLEKFINVRGKFPPLRVAGWYCVI